MAEWKDCIHIQFATEYHLQQPAVTEVYRCSTYAPYRPVLAQPLARAILGKASPTLNIHVFQ